MGNRAVAMTGAGVGPGSRRRQRRPVRASSGEPDWRKVIGSSSLVTLCGLAPAIPDAAPVPLSSRPPWSGLLPPPLEPSIGSFERSEGLYRRVGGTRFLLVGPGPS